MDLQKFEVNKIYEDDFGRISGVFAVDKEIGKLSHDVVYEYRRKFNTKKVGHAGTLDPFASGLLIILVGKATKLSDQFLSMDKEYIADIAFGIKTDTLDPEGNITDLKDATIQITQDIIISTLKTFQASYQQTVPIYSSVKVKGKKLRELARNHDSFSIKENQNVEFMKDGEVKKTVSLPIKKVNIYEIELQSLNPTGINSKEIPSELKNKILSKPSDTNSLMIGKIRVRCSKGTYIRKLAEDIGLKLGIPSMLIGLRRTKVGSITI